jgi:hypothetical protein
VPTVLRIGPYRFHFYAADGAEPPHVHIAGPYSGSPKFWLEPVSLAEAAGVAPHTLREIQRHIEDNRDHLIRSWHEFFSPPQP